MLIRAFTAAYGEDLGNQIYVTLRRGEEWPPKTCDVVSLGLGEWKGHKSLPFLNITGLSSADCIILQVTC